MLLDNSFSLFCVWLMKGKATGILALKEMIVYALKPRKTESLMSLGTARSLLLERSKAWREIKYIKIEQK